ncbi:Os11g0544833 [Oryza sativa Japonica Group]|uniref:Os11g0544833 protein n=1 Tax=Oryza sativa subsp. japonica TaxID=39947 RepID=A0A0P0Y3V4_ORYSJ|nr:Os11g0544833 [Oryza sativa Japonica Group]
MNIHQSTPAREVARQEKKGIPSVRFEPRWRPRPRPPRRSWLQTLLAGVRESEEAASTLHAVLRRRGENAGAAGGGGGGGGGGNSG